MILVEVDQDVFQVLEVMARTVLRAPNFELVQAHFKLPLSAGDREAYDPGYR